MKTRTNARSFGAGELSPLLHSRSDLVPNQTGLALCSNFTTLPQGPARFRPGSRFLNYGPNFVSSPYSRLIPFIYSDDQAYIVELQWTKIRIHTPAGTLLDVGSAVNIVDITQGDPGEILLPTSAGIASLTWVFLTVTGMVELSGRWYQLVQEGTSGSNTRYSLITTATGTARKVDTSGYGAFVSGTVEQALTLNNPFSTTGELEELRYAQSADVLTITSPLRKPHTLRRTGPNTWAIVEETFGPGVSSPTNLTATADGPGGGTPTTHHYVVTTIVTDGSANAESLAHGPASVSQDLTVPGNTVILASTPAVASGTRRNYYKALNGLYGFIGQGGASFVDNNITPDLSIAPPEYGEDFSGAGNSPRAVSYFQQRKMFGGSVNSPQTVWATRNGTETDTTFTIPSRDDDALQFRIASRDAQTVHHLVPLQNLLVLTSGGVWEVVAQNSDVLTPSSVGVELRSYQGASEVQPPTAESAVLYAFARGGRVGEIRYSEGAGGVAVSDLSLLAPHLFDGYFVKELALLEAPVRTLVVLRSDGIVLTMTYEPEHRITAWHQHDFGGEVMSLCAVPAVTSNGVSEDILALAIVRENDEAEKYTTIETWYGLGDYPVDHRVGYYNAESDLAANRAVHQDSALVYVGPAVTRVIGLFHLEGREVNPVCNGAVHPPVTVTNGEITLEAPATRVVVGLPYVGRIKTLPLSLEGQVADGKGTVKNIDKVYLNLWQSSGVWVGPTFEHMDELKARTDEPYGVAPRWKSGEHELSIDPLWGREGELCVEQRAPMPLLITGMTLEVEVGG